MARTPLFHLVRRSLAHARIALRSEAPPDEVAGILAEARGVGVVGAGMLAEARGAGVVGAGMLAEARGADLSRRGFVRTSALGVAGTAVLGACAPRAGSGTPEPGARGVGPVVVVGAGIAGLTAAHRLRQAGVPVRIAEAQSRVGGRMLSLRNYFADGQVAELGGELVDTNHAAIRGLAAELGIEMDDLTAEDPGIGGETWHFGGRVRSESEVVEAFRPVARIIEAELAPLGEDTTHTDDGGAGALDRMTLAEWLDRAEVDGWFRTLLDVAYTTEYGLEPEDQSALNFVYMIDPEPDPFRIFGDSDERFHIRGGNDLVPRRLAEGLDDAIETGMVLERVALTPDGRYRLTFQRGAGTVEWTAERVVLALPFTLLRQVRLDLPLPEVKRRAIDELGYGTNAKLMIGYSDRVWRRVHRANGSVVTDLPFQLMWETSRKQAGDAGILTNFTGGRHGAATGSGTQAEWAARVTEQLEAVFPGVAAARDGMKEARFHWPSHPWTLGSYASYRPGQWTGIRGAEGSAVGGLHFAGEHTSLEFQGFMEGGCESGERVAGEILAALGVRVGAAGPRAPGRAMGRRALLFPPSTPTQVVSG
jgi:monoamine oxidase